jgi:hypothetical protein
MQIGMRTGRGRGVVTATALTASATLAFVSVAGPASAAAGCGTARTGHGGNSYQSCATSSVPGKLATTNIFEHDAGVTVFQVGIATNGGAVVWGLTGSVAPGSSTVSAGIGCTPGSTVRGALRTRYRSTWDPTAYSGAVLCA